MTPRAQRIRGWMLAQPRPAIVVVRGPNPHEVTTDGSASWASVAETIDSLGPESLEALSADRKLIRAVKVEQIEEAPEPSAPQSVHELDAETRRFEIFAAHLSAAYQHATGVAFERLAGLFDATARRTEALERALARHVEIQLAQAQETSDPLTSLAGAFLSGANGATALPTAPTTNGKPNGGGH